jgi:nucleoside-diphosphate-sugar epimerase
MKILLTGATGFVPSNMILHFYAAGHTIVAFDLYPPEERLLRELGPGWEERVTFLQGDVRDEATVFRLFEEHRPSHVVHAAAITPNLQAERERPRLVVEVNEVSTISMLQAASRSEVQRFIYVSSGAVYEENNPAAYVYDEDALLHNGDRIYGLSKIAAEKLCRWAHAHYGIDVRMTRLGTVYGPFERPTSARQNMSSARQATGLALAGETLRCTAPHIRQNWIHARDIAKGLLLLLEAPDLQHDTYNVVGEAVSQERLINAVVAAVPGTKVEWVRNEDEANVPMSGSRNRAALDNRRLWQDTGFQPSFTIETGILDYVTWQRDQ